MHGCETDSLQTLYCACVCIDRENLQLKVKGKGREISEHKENSILLFTPIYAAEHLTSPGLSVLGL